MTRIKDLRIERQLTQLQMASLLGITRGAYANIENGRREPDISTLIFLADYFSVSVDYLIEHTPSVCSSSPVSIGEISAKELDIIQAYRTASADDKSIIDNIVRRYSQRVSTKTLA